MSLSKFILYNSVVIIIFVNYCGSELPKASLFFVCFILECGPCLHIFRHFICFNIFIEHCITLCNKICVETVTDVFFTFFHNCDEKVLSRLVGHYSIVNLVKPKLLYVLCCFPTTRFRHFRGTNVCERGLDCLGFVGEEMSWYLSQILVSFDYFYVTVVYKLNFNLALGYRAKHLRSVPFSILIE